MRPLPTGRCPHSPLKTCYWKKCPCAGSPVNESATLPPPFTPHLVISESPQPWGVWSPAAHRCSLRWQLLCFFLPQSQPVLFLVTAVPVFCLCLTEFSRTPLHTSLSRCGKDGLFVVPPSDLAVKTHFPPYLPAKKDVFGPYVRNSCFCGACSFRLKLPSVIFSFFRVSRARKTLDVGVFQVVCFCVSPQESPSFLVVLVDCTLQQPVFHPTRFVSASSLLSAFWFLRCPNPSLVVRFRFFFPLPLACLLSSSICREGLR